MISLHTVADDPQPPQNISDPSSERNKPQSPRRQRNARNEPQIEGSPVGKSNVTGADAEHATIPVSNGNL